MEDYELIEIVDSDEHLVSGRDMPLVLCMKYEWITPVLTVEFYTKWYELFLIEKKDQQFHILSIHFGHLDAMFDRTYVEDEGNLAHRNMATYVDHVPNPLFVQLLAKRNGYHLDELASNLITGRWQEEVVNQMVMECDRCEGAGIVAVEPAYGGKIPQTCRACKGYGVLKPGA